MNERQKTNYTRMKKLILLISMLMFCFAVSAKKQTKEIYEWRIYTVSGNGAELDKFFEKTLIPAFNRQGAKVGAFTSFKKEEKELRYLLMVFPDIETWLKSKKAIWSDKIFREAAQPYFETTAPNPLYTDFETFVCEAFDKIPKMRTPDKNRTLFEFRLYHSPNEEANQRKIRMFNVDEIDVFDKNGINSVCYGEILAGTRMPALIYLTWYKDETTRNAAWDKFRVDPDWVRIRDLQEYANTATRNESFFLSPMPYSQF